MLARLMGKADAVAAAVPEVTEASLKTSRTEIESQLRTLTKERDGLSLASLSGDANATTAIESIDRDRQRLAGQVESINAALRELASKPRLRTLADFGPQEVRRMQARLRNDVLTGRASLSDSIDYGAHRPDVDGGLVRVRRLEAIEPLTIAKRILGTYVKEEPISYEKSLGRHNTVNESREREISRLAGGLVASVELPPLPETLTRYAEGR